MRLPSPGPAAGAAPIHLLDDALELARIGTWTFDPLTRTTWVSRQAAQLYGSDARFLEQDGEATKRIHPDDAAAVRAAVDATVAGGPPYAVDFRILQADSSLRWVQGRGRLTMHEGKALLVGTLQDVTERKQLERLGDEAAAQAREAEQLRRMNEFKARFINIAAHELKTPLTPMRIQVALLGEVYGPSLDDRVRHSVAILSRSVERLTRLVDDVLEAARLQANSLKLDRHPLDATRLAHHLAEAYEPAAKQVGVRLVTSLAPDLRVEADATRLEQVISNLISNALKFTPDGGRVKLAGRQESGKGGAHVVLEVEDTGLGMTDEQRSRLFLPFSQVHDNPEQRLRGTGLGLFICKGIVEEHGGTISAESAGPGKGSLFRVRLPATLKTVPPPPPAPERSTAKRFRELI